MYIQITAVQAILTCLFLSFTYVSSLYLLWSGSILHNRNDPTVILRRMVSVLLVCLLAPLSLYYYSTDTPPTTTTPTTLNLPFHHYLNLTTINLLYSITLSTLLICILYLGSLYTSYLDTQLIAYRKDQSYTENLYEQLNNAYLHNPFSLSSLFKQSLRWWHLCVDKVRE